MSGNIPIWLQPFKIESFPTRPMNNNIVQCSLALPRAWDITPEMNETPLEIEHIFRGIIPTDGLVISFMEKADPQANLRDWVELILGVTGFPILPISQAFTTIPHLLKWEYLENQSSLPQQFQVDEIHLYQGWAQFGTASNLACLYLILARRGTCAWKIGLSLLSIGDRPKSTQNDLQNIADEERAGAILGELSFL